MSDLHDDVPSAKRPRTGDSSIDVHGLEANAPSEQHTSEGAAPSQQAAAKDMFGLLTARRNSSKLSASVNKLSDLHVLS